MSYEIIKGIKVDNKNKKIFLRSSSNNVTPKTYSRWEFMQNEYDLEIKKRQLFFSIITGSSTLRICDNKNWRYASCKFNDYCKENNISVDEIWDLYHKDGNLENIEKYYKKFEEFLNEKHKGLYYLNSNQGLIIGLTHKGFFYSNQERPKEKYCSDYKTTYIKRSKLSEDTIKKYDITINRFEKIKEANLNEDYVL